MRQHLVLALCGLVVAACSAPTSDLASNSAAPTATSNAGNADLQAFLEASRQAADYTSHANPAALARHADVVVAGRIVDVRPGQEYAEAPGEPPAIATSVLDVAVERVVSGDATSLTGGRVYVEVPHPGRVTPVEQGTPQPFPHDQYAANVPRTDALFFLEDRTHEPYWETVLNQGAGRPAGAPIMSPYMQGFLIEDSTGRLVGVFDDLATMGRPWSTYRTLEEVEDAATKGDTS